MIKIDPLRLEKFFELAFERHKIFVLKTLGAPKPWTKDPIFQNWFFCNVFRRIDKTTVWLEQNVIKTGDDAKDNWKNIILYRYISNYETYREMKSNIDIYDRKQVYRFMREKQKNKEKIFTDAFICNSGIGDRKFVDKVTYIFTLLKYMHDDGFTEFINNTNSLKETFKRLRWYPGIADFMAYEYTTDFTYSNYLNESPEIYTWCDLGLGAVRGLNRLIKGYESKKAIPNKLEYCNYIFDEWKKYIALNIEKEINRSKLILQDINSFEAGVQLYKLFLNLTMREVEHWLCEYDKYCRGGSKKRRYNGP